MDEELRRKLENAARAEPALRRALSGDVRREDLPAVADAAASVGLYDLSEVLREVAGLPAAEGAAKIAGYLAGLDDSELDEELRDALSELRDIAEVGRVFRGILGR